jgi:myo-inositol-hexaphosphate 3-phosphohydrolase/PKD repeat protein
VASVPTYLPDKVLIRGKMSSSHARARARRITAALTVSLLVAALSVIATGSPSYAVESPVLVPSNLETTPVAHSGDAMDDPAVWVNPSDKTSSLVIGNDKGGALESYDLQGNLVQRLAFGTDFWGNVDVKQAVTIGNFSGDLVGAVQSSVKSGGTSGVRFYTVNPTTRQMSAVTEGSAPIGPFGEGFCMYQSPTSHKVYGYTITIQGLVRQFELTDTDNNGKLEASLVRSFQVGSEAEGCVADDDTGALYVSEEDVALWRYSAEPTGGTTREAVDTVGAPGHLVSDIEGATLVDQADGGGFIIASAQNVADPNHSYFSVYKRGAGNDFVNTFRVVNGTNSDDCDRTDGITAVTADLGTAFPRGIFVCQDNNNDLPGTSGNQNLKMVRLENVVNLDGGAPPPPPPPPPPSSISFVGQSTANGNSASYTVPVPAATQAGDALFLFASYGNTVSLTGPGAGWTPVGTKVVDNTVATSVWRRTAVSGDAGTPVKMTNGTTVTKVALTLAAYRGVDPSNPVAAVDGAGEPGTTAAHTTPLVANSTSGAWRLSYWTDKNAATTHWTAPGGETTRATTVGTGSGRIDTLLTDPASPMTAGTPANTGGLVATADATSSAATMWTLLLKPAADTPPVNQPPVARFTSDCTGLACTLDGSTSSDAEDSISSYAWDFKDGTTGTQMTEDHTFPSAGTYAVKLTVTDDVGATNTVTHDVTVGTPPPPSAISFVGQASSNVNSATVTVKVPATVVAGDALLLFAAQGKSLALTGPGAGWTQIGNVVDVDVSTTVWRRVATGSDAGSTVQLSTGTTISKIAVTVAAYRGTSTTLDPVLAVAGAPEPGSSTSHTTPTVANNTTGAWRVSYWSDKNASTTQWLAPSGETVRGTTFGTGSGRVDALLTDSNAALTAGSPPNTGGLTATADGSADKATTWTVLLRPAG